MTPSELRAAAIDLLNERLGPNDYRVSTDVDRNCAASGVTYTRYGICVWNKKPGGDMVYFVSGQDAPGKALERLANQLPTTSDLLAVGM